MTHLLSPTSPRKATTTRVVGGMAATVGLVAGLIAFGAAPASAQEASPPGFGDCGNVSTTFNDLSGARIVDEKFSNNRYAEVVYEVNGRYEHWRADPATLGIGRVACKPKPVNEQQPPKFSGGGGGDGGSASVGGGGGGGISFISSWSRTSYSGTVTVGPIAVMQQ